MTKPYSQPSVWNISASDEIRSIGVTRPCRPFEKLTSSEIKRTQMHSNALKCTQVHSISIAINFNRVQPLHSSALTCRSYQKLTARLRESSAEEMTA